MTSAIDNLIFLLSKIPGLGPRSARRAALHLINNREQLLKPLGGAIELAANNVQSCEKCGNIGTDNTCNICSDEKRDCSVICVVESVADLWALERTAAFKGVYHVLGGVLSPIDGIGPDDLKISNLVNRASKLIVKEVILATSVTVDGKTTAHYITDVLEKCEVKITMLAHGIPIGGQLDFLDDGTLSAALTDRRNSAEI